MFKKLPNIALTQNSPRVDIQCVCAISHDVDPCIHIPQWAFIAYKGDTLTFTIFNLFDNAFTFILEPSYVISATRPVSNNTFSLYYHCSGGEGWLEFPDLWSGQKPWWNWCLTPVANFGEVRRAQLAKSTLLTSSLVPLGSFQIF